MLMLCVVSILICIMTSLAILTLSAQPDTTNWRHDAIMSGFALLVGIPAIVLSNGFKGILEADHKFSIINTMRVPLGIWTFAAPLLVSKFFGPSLLIISLALSLGRYINLYLYIITSGERFRPSKWISQYKISIMRKMATSGGWMSLSSLLSAFMGYVDRFILAYVASPAAVSYYAIPHEIITKLWIVPTSVVSAAFPTMVRSQFDRKDITAVLFKSFLIVITCVLPLSAALAYWSESILSGWISVKFSQQSSPVLSILCFGMLFGALGAVPFNALHALDKQKLTAKIHCCEFPVFLFFIYILSQKLGPFGAALAWTSRCIIDFFIMTWFCISAVKSIKPERP